MQNSPKCVVMETRYMVDTTSQELPIEEKTFLKFAYSSALFFFSNDANGTSNFADFLTNMCISNCVRSVFFFKPWLALCEVDFCYCDISNWYLWQVERFSYDLEMKTRKQNRNNRQTKIERFDWFIEWIWTRVAFGWLSEPSGEKTSCLRTF